MNGSITIPEKFKLNGKSVIVIIDDNYLNDQVCLGEADFDQRVITLCSRFKGRKLTKKEREQTYYHELVHMILDSMGEDKLMYNEVFVEDFAQRWYEYEKSKQ